MDTLVLISRILTALCARYRNAAAVAAEAGCYGKANALDAAAHAVANVAYHAAESYQPAMGIMSYGLCEATALAAATLREVDSVYGLSSDETGQRDGDFVSTLREADFLA